MVYVQGGNAGGYAKMYSALAASVFTVYATQAGAQWFSFEGEE